jgi:hypothetical protein
MNPAPPVTSETAIVALLLVLGLSERFEANPEISITFRKRLASSPESYRGHGVRLVFRFKLS